MAEKPEDKTSDAEKILQAKELIGRGTRNYYIDAYVEAADDLSQACSIYSTLFGPIADELGTPYLYYAKSLVAVAQAESKLVGIPEEDEENDGEDDDEEDDEEENDNQENNSDSKIKNDDKETKKTSEEESGEKVLLDGTSDPEENKSENETNKLNKSMEGLLNGHTESENPDSEDKPDSSHTNGINTDENKDEEDDGTALQVAWEVLELAVQIFKRQGETAAPSLADAYSELANISFENSFFEIAIKDYNKAYDTYLDLVEPNRRILAELQYKIGLCYIMLNDYEQAIKSLTKATEIFDDEIEFEKAKDMTEDVKNTIKDLEETKQEIMNKIIDVEESKLQSIEEVKKELAKLIEPLSGITSLGSTSSTDGAGPSSEANKPKPLDISHLIKRKKPETETKDETVTQPPTKKPSL